VTDGCIYVSANIKQAGVLLQHGEILRVFFGVREKEDLKKLNGQLDGEYKAERLLKKIAQDFKDSGIDGILSDNIKRDALTKFSYVSPIGTAGLYLHAVAGDFQREGEARELFKTLIREIVTLANAMGITFEEDLVERNLKILSNLPKEATTSMQRDVMEGKQSEIDGLVYEVVRMAEKYGAEVPAYRRAAEKFREMEVK
jgi:2-dehydropantoate 2-reductase